MVMDWFSRLITDRLTEPTGEETPGWPKQIGAEYPGSIPSSRPCPDRWVTRCPHGQGQQDRITPAVTLAMVPAAAM